MFAKNLRLTQRCNYAAFTLVELLVVIAIIGILVALLLPAVQAARETARRIQCTNQMKQVGLAVMNYESAQNKLPLSKTPAYIGPFYGGTCPGEKLSNLKPYMAYDSSAEGSAELFTRIAAEHNLIAFLLPYMEQQNIADLYEFNASWSRFTNYDSTTNTGPSTIPINELICPSGPSSDERAGAGVQAFFAAASDYAVCGAIETRPTDGYCTIVSSGIANDRPLENLQGLLSDRPSTFRKVTDGLSKTIMLVEDAGRPLHYIRGEVSADNDGFITNAPNRNAGSDGGPWADPNSFFVWGRSTGECGLTSIMNCTNRDEIYSFHPGGCNFLYGDGSVHFLTEDMNVNTFVTLFTRAGEDVIEELP